MISLAYWGIIVGLCAILLGLAFGFRKKLKQKQNLILKIVVLVLAGIFAIRFLWSGDALTSVFCVASGTPLESPFLTLVGTLLLWFSYAGLLSVILYPFFKRAWLLHFIKFWALPVYLLILGFLIPVFMLTEGHQAFNGFNLRLMFFAIEIAIALSVSVYLFVTNGFFKSTKKDWIKFALLIVPVLLSVMPTSIPQNLFGFGNVVEEVKDFSPYHRVLLYAGAAIPFVIYFLLRKKDKEFIRSFLLFVSLGTMISFSREYTFASFLNPTSWPLHLCNTAMYLVPLCLIFRLNKLFYFTLFINVFGAFLAMAMPNYTADFIFRPRVVTFWVNHYIAFFMPIIIISLGLYERPKLKQFIHSMIGFAMYFALVLIINAWFTNYGSCDFFFINSNFIASKLGKWAEKIRDIVWVLNIGELKFIFYPLYQFLFFLVYCLLGLAIWFVYEQFFTIADAHKDMYEKKKKIKLDHLALLSQLNGRSIEDPMEIENKDKLIIKDLCKRYGNSDVYAVKNANMEVNAGEIFGFLGPNGAGKSTIIKSIVGIHPITSGQILVCGYDAEKQPVMAKQQIGFVPDHYALYEKLTGREYINYIADLYEVSLEDRNQRIEKYINLFELQGAFDNQMKTYSHGMKQKIAIMAALVHNPKIWILDEPLTGLDPNSIYQVKECMKNHAKEGNIVFFSSHIIDVVERICDRITIIKKGEIQTSVTIKELEEKNVQLEDFYLEIINGTSDLSSLNKAEDNAEIKQESQQQNTEIAEQAKQENAQEDTTSDETETTKNQPQTSKKSNIFAKIFKKHDKK